MFLSSNVRVDAFHVKGLRSAAAAVGKRETRAGGGGAFSSFPQLK
jgi:hypothetical protein